MAETTVTCTVSPCTVVVQFQNELFNIDPEGGVLIASAIIAVWAMGYGIRSVIRALNTDGNNSTSESE